MLKISMGIVTLVVIVALISAAVSSTLREKPNTMPSGFTIHLGDTKEEVFGQLGMGEKNLKGGYYTKALADERFKAIEVSFKYNELTSAGFSVNEKLCGKPTFVGMREALDNKLGCLGSLKEESKTHALVMWDHCPNLKDAKESLYLLLSHDEASCHLAMAYHVDMSVWVPKGTKIDL